MLQLQSGEMDLEITALLDSDNREQAIEKKKEAIVLLVSEVCRFVVCRPSLRLAGARSRAGSVGIRSHHAGGRPQDAEAAGKQEICEQSEKGNLARCALCCGLIQRVQAVQYGGYLQRRASISAMDQLQG